MTPPRPKARPRRANPRPGPEPALSAEFRLRADPANPGRFVLRHEARVGDPDLRAALASGNAGIVVRVLCPATYFSEAREAPVSGETILERAWLRGSVRVSCLVVSRRYWRSGADALAPGAVLAGTKPESLPDPSAARGDGPLRLPRAEALDGLFKSVERNLDRYIEGDFSGTALERDAPESSEARLLPAPIARLRPKSGGSVDAANAALVFDALPGLTPRLARSEALWVWLCHGPCLDYARRRWIPAGASKAEIAKSVRTHFFARVDGDRAFTRNNAVACLWWWAHIASRYPRADTRRSLEILLSRTDVRTAVLERPSTARDTRVFTALMDVLFSRYEEDSKRPFFSQRNPYRVWLKKVESAGQARSLDVMPEAELRALFERLASEAEAEAEPRSKKTESKRG